MVGKCCKPEFGSSSSAMAIQMIHRRERAPAVTAATAVEFSEEEIAVDIESSDNEKGFNGFWNRLCHVYCLGIN
jgi:hypothetical protein